MTRSNPSTVAPDPRSPAADSWLTRLARMMSGVVPDAITTSILLLLVLIVTALALGNGWGATWDAYYRGLWMLLPFTMQMTLILVLSSMLAAAPLVRRLVLALSRRPTSAAQVVTGVALLTAALSYLYWGLGVAMGPLIAVFFAAEAERKGIRVDFPYLVCVSMAATSVWQFGLSSSSALLMATPGHFLEATTGVMPLRTTIWTPAALTQVLAFALVTIVAGVAMLPARPEPISSFPEAFRVAEEGSLADRARPEPAGATSGLPFSDRLERNPLVMALLGAALIAWLVLHFGVKKQSLELNSLNTILLLSCVLLHRNVFNFVHALQRAVVTCWPVIVIYHLYAGVAGVIQHTNVGEHLAGLVAAVATPLTFPLLAAIAGTAVAVFVPSTGGQWVIQGFVTVKAAESLGLSAQRGLLSLGVGDQMGNLVSPFWMVVAAGIARIDFRRFYGYSLFFAALWFALGVVVFTLLPS
jgi:short-chain fatty acids transporter